MKRTIKQATVLTAGLVLVSTISPVSAWAESSPAPTVSAGTTAFSVPDFTPVQAAYKAAQETYNASKQTGGDFKNLIQAFITYQKAYKDQIKAINQAFKDAAQSARNNFQAGLPAAKTASARAQLRATRDAALVTATLARDNAVAALGALPSRPVKPVKSAK